MTEHEPPAAFSVGEMLTGETYYCSVCGAEYGHSHTRACRLYHQQIAENERLRAAERGQK